MSDLDRDGPRLLLRLVWPAAMVLSLILILTIGLVGFALFLTPSEGVKDLGQAMSEANSITRLVTLVIIVPAIVLLAIIDKIEGGAAAAALSAISGYVFGSLVGKGP